MEVSNWVERSVRQCEAELALMERAAEINDVVLKRMVGECRVGMSEI